MPAKTLKYGRYKIRGRWKQLTRTNLSWIYLFAHDGFSLHEYVPRPLLRWFIHPWALPNQFIVKAIDHNCRVKDIRGDAAEEREMCDTELDGYAVMRPIQGRIVPICYGGISVEGSDKPALAVQYLRGKNLGPLTRAPEKWEKPYEWTQEEICTGIQRCLAEISKYGVKHCDLDFDRLNQFMYADVTCWPSLSWVTDTIAILTELLLGWLTPLTFCCYLCFSCFVQLRLQHQRQDRCCSKQVFLLDFGDWEFDDYETCREENMEIAEGLCETFLKARADTAHGVGLQHRRRK